MIKFLVMDVDGTLTDSKVYMGDNGEVFKAFDIKDGCGIKEILPRYGIVPVIITARKSHALKNRCDELGVKELHQGCRKKLEKLQDVLNSYHSDMSSVAYIGDDFLDIPPMKAVQNAGGLAVCPNNAIESVRQIADFICHRNAGDGAVREFIDWLVSFIDDKYILQIRNHSEEAYRFAKHFFRNHYLDGAYQLADGVIANVMTYISKPFEMTFFESHKKYIDVQYMIYGEEMMLVENTANMASCVSDDYNEEKDVTLYRYNRGSCHILKAGHVIVLKPEDGHRGAIAVGTPEKVRKIVFKVPVNS